MFSTRRPLHQYGIGALLLLFVVSAGYGIYMVWQSDLRLMGLKSSKFGATSDFVLAEHYFSTEHYDLQQARFHYSEAIKASSTAYALAWYQLARIDFLEGKFDAALSKLDMQLKYFDDEIPSVYYMIGLVHAFRADRDGNEADWKKAEDNFLMFITYMPDSPWARINLAWIYFHQDNYQEMLAALEPIYDTEQNNAWYLNMYGLALFNVGEVEQASDIFARVLVMVDTLTPADWARVYPENNPTDWAQGLEEFKEVVARNVALVAAVQAGQTVDNPGL